ncbi:MAG: Rrf2 family transcriptional regulator [Pseudooceanicola sp.]|jgi:Rrf2 family nitric oxide-sensitive transcriptional repressor|nr:Rrf2 family transcriptional regulator [Pseudooceanicola sp.]|tara:strand:- start:330 stop:761 length:432 start_codon:yes stop_codon:yes gene_type:complete
MRLTKRTDMAIRLLMYCSANSDRLVTKTEVAEACDLSFNHLAQIVLQLARLDLIVTRRGRNGGFSLGRPAEEICIGGVVRALEPKPVLPENCREDSAAPCRDIATCLFRKSLLVATEAFLSTLDGLTLADLANNAAGPARIPA